jgi:putative spermidine/putrescine transport system permease protein
LVSSAGSIPTAQLQRSLKELRRAERVQKWRAFALVAPLLLFLVVTFVLPIGAMLLRSVQDPEFGAVLPRTAQALRQWDESALPDARLVEIFAAELVAGRQAGTLSAAANRLNYDVNGFRTLLLRTARPPSRLWRRSTRAGPIARPGRRCGRPLGPIPASIFSRRSTAE